jgi:protein ImuB
VKTVPGNAVPRYLGNWVPRELSTSYLAPPEVPRYSLPSPPLPAPAMRIACVIVPLFPLAARLRSEPELISEAVALMEGNGNTARVVWATRRARKEGIRQGLTLAQARAIMPRLIARGRDSECERAAQEALFEAAERFSPRIEEAGEGVVFLDVDGLERHFSGENRERELAHALIRSVEAAGLPARVGIASSKLASRIAAELPKTPNIVPEGIERKFLEPLPLERLAPEIEMATMLQKLGISSIGELARLPEAEVASRFGETGRELHFAARGVDVRPLIPRQPPPDFREGMELEWPIVALEPFLFVAHAALERLVRRLETSGYSCRILQMSLRLEPDGHHERRIELPAPTRDLKTLLTLIRLDLEQTPPGAPIAGFSMVATPDQPRQGQLSLFGPLALAHDKLTEAIARIASRIGTERIGMAAPLDVHRPDGYAVDPFDPPPPPRVRRVARRSKGLLAVRSLRPAIALQVVTEENGRRRPRKIAVSSPDASTAKKELKIDGSVRVASGPWRIEEEWWAEAPIRRDYWDVELSDGGIYRIFHDQQSNAWFADGVYD